MDGLAQKYGLGFVITSAAVQIGFFAECRASVRRDTQKEVSPELGGPANVDLFQVLSHKVARTPLNPEPR